MARSFNPLRRAEAMGVRGYYAVLCAYNKGRNPVGPRLDEKDAFHTAFTV